jgi:hypothetical protein
MSQEVNEASSKEQESKPSWRHKLFAFLKERCMQHKREKPLGAPPSIGQSVVAILKASCEPLRTLTPTSTDQLLAV